MKRTFTTLTDATLITAVVQNGFGEVITDALLEVGIQGSTLHKAMGVGIRERLGAVGVAVDAERDVVNVLSLIHIPSPRDRTRCRMPSSA